MPIAGITDGTIRYPRLGKIHLGYRDETKKGAPTAVDYFVCPEEVQAVFGEKPKELRVMIPTPDRERFASQYYRCYSKTHGLVCKGDGLNCLRAVDEETGGLANRDSKSVAMQEMGCEGRECEYYGKQCREIMNFQFLLPEVPGLGVWQIDTSSINSIRNINAVADLLGEKISMMPLLLTLEPIPVQDPESKKKRTVYALNLKTNFTLSKLLALPPAIASTVELPVSDEEADELLFPETGEAPTATTGPEAKKAEAKKAKAAKATASPKMTPEELLARVAEVKGWKSDKPARSFLVNVFKIDEKRINEDPGGVYEEVKEML
jgi:hypothetical protein